MKEIFLGLFIGSCVVLFSINIYNNDLRDKQIKVLQDQIAGLSLENARLRSEIIYYSHDHRILEGLRERVDEHEGTLRQMGTLQTRVFDLEQKVFPEKYRWAPSDYGDYGD